ncbi:reverse transcriptase domain-containing protein, partial [Acinetobacter baumannii]|uniref:reverse transcriptase domain-containing protein n=1 Tax=Acinetobacter baumannii TaxID=470 RepID=UPI00339261F5
MQHYGVPEIFIDLIQQLYRGATCQVVHKGKLTEVFEVNTGVRQGGLLSPMIFLLALDWIMRETTKTEQTGIQWTLTRVLEDLDYADDICLISQKHEHRQSKTDRLAQEAAKTGLEINTEKTETMSLHTDQQSPIKIRGQELKEVDTFVYFGSTVTATGGSNE